jgi:uncharacterized protein HemX
VEKSKVGHQEGGGVVEFFLLIGLVAVIVAVGVLWWRSQAAKEQREIRQLEAETRRLAEQRALREAEASLMEARERIVRAEGEADILQAAAESIRKDSRLVAWYAIRRDVLVFLVGLTVFVVVMGTIVLVTVRESGGRHAS